MEYEYTCPRCSAKNRMEKPLRAKDFSLSGILPGRPEVGDVTVCPECAAPLRYIKVGVGATWSIITEDEMLAMPDDERIMITKMMKLMKSKHNDFEGCGRPDCKVCGPGGPARSGKLPVQAIAILAAQKAYETCSTDEEAATVALNAFNEFMEILAPYLKGKLDLLEGVKFSVAGQLIGNYIIGQGSLEGARADVKDDLEKYITKNGPIPDSIKGMVK